MDARISICSLVRARSDLHGPGTSHASINQPNANLALRIRTSIGYCITRGLESLQQNPDGPRMPWCFMIIHTPCLLSHDKTATASLSRPCSRPVIPYHRYTVALPRLSSTSEEWFKIFTWKLGCLSRCFFKFDWWSSRVLTFGSASCLPRNAGDMCLMIRGCCVSLAFKLISRMVSDKLSR